MAPTPAPSKKLPTADPNPKPGPPVTPPNSASSSSSPEKRTRDQPNLSDCHCCSRRINHTNPKDRLQPLDSVWRIVLLCRKCRKSVRSGDTCPYCFRETADSGELVQCKVCESKIHGGCVREYGNCRPWCYLKAELGGFGACVDCWVPESLKSSVRVCRGSESKGVLKEDGLEKLRKDGKCEGEKKGKLAGKAKGRELRKSVVTKSLVKDTLDFVAETDKDEQKRGDSGDAMDDAELAIKLHRAINSSPRISWSDCRLSSNDLSVLRIRNWSGLSYKRAGVGRDRPSGQKSGLCVNSGVNKLTSLTGGNGACCDVIGLKFRPLTYTRDKKRKIWHLSDEDTLVFGSKSIQPEDLEFKSHSDDARTSCSTDVSETLFFVDANEGVPRTDIDRYISEALSCIDSLQNISCVNGDRFGQNPVIYQRTRFKKKSCQERNLAGGSLKCKSCDNNSVVCKPEHCQQDDAKQSSGCLMKCEAAVIFPNANSDAKPNRYYLKYGKRVTGTKSYFSRLHSESCVVENQDAPALRHSGTGDFVKCGGKLVPNERCNTEIDRYCIKYVKRVKYSKSESNLESRPYSDAFQSQHEASVPGLTVNCSTESGSVSDNKLVSSINDLP